MTLADWDQSVSPHLQLIEAGAQMVTRHALALPVKPDFESKAQSQLAETRAVLERALENIIAAEAIYASKPLEWRAA